MAPTQSKSIITINRNMRPLLVARQDGMKVIAWLSMDGRHYAIRSYTPQNLSMPQTQWLSVALLRAQNAIKKVVC